MTSNEALNSRLENLTNRLEYSIAAIEEEIQNNCEPKPETQGKLGDVVWFIATSFIVITTARVAIEIVPAIKASAGLGEQIFAFFVFGYFAVDFSATAAKALVNIIKNIRERN